MLERASYLISGLGRAREENDEEEEKRFPICRCIMPLLQTAESFTLPRYPPPPPWVDVVADFPHFYVWIYFRKVSESYTRYARVPTSRIIFINLFLPSLFCHGSSRQAFFYSIHLFTPRLLKTDITLKYRHIVVDLRQRVRFGYKRR